MCDDGDDGDTFCDDGVGVGDDIAHEGSDVGVVESKLRNFERVVLLSSSRWLLTLLFDVVLTFLLLVVTVLVATLLFLRGW